MPYLKSIGGKPKDTNKQWSYNNDKFYHTTTWRKLRDYKIRQQPLCEVCLKEGKAKEAKVIDHHRPKRLFPELALILSNLTSMCESHHNKKSRLERDCQDQYSWQSVVENNDMFKKG